MKNHPATTVINPEGGSVAWPQGNVLITFPAGTFHTPVTLFLSSASSTPSSLFDYGLNIRIEAFDPSGNPVTQLNRPVTITFSFAGQEYWIAPRLNIYSQQGNGDWLPLSTFYGPGPNQFYAQTSHLSSFGLLGSDAGNFRKMAADSAGKVYFLDGPVVYRHSPGSMDRELYFDLSSTIGAQAIYGDLAINTETNDLYIGNADKIYKLTPGKQLSALFNLPFNGNVVHGLHFSPYYQSLFISAVYGTYQVNPNNGSLTRTIWQGYGSQDVATDSHGGLFVLYRGDQQSPSLPFPTDSTIVYWPSIVQQESCSYNLPGFLSVDRLAMDGGDSLLVPNGRAEALSIVGGSEVTATGFIRITKPQNVVETGGNLIVAAQGGLKVLPGARRDASSANPQLVSGDTISGQGNLVRFAWVDPVPAHNVLRINGNIQRWITSFSAGTVAYDLNEIGRCGETGNALTPPRTDPLAAYASPVHSYQISVETSVSNSGTLAVPEPGNWQVVDVYSENYVARGTWGIFDNSFKVVSNNGLFPVWEGNTASGWNGLAYQFNQLGRFQFTKNNSETFYVNVTPAGNPGCMGSGQMHIVPADGTIFRFYGAVLEVPPGALPGIDLYTLEMSVCNNPNPGKDTLTASSFKYQVKFTPDPPQLLQPIVLRLPYDPSQPGNPPQAAYFDPGVGDLVKLDSNPANGYVNIAFPAGMYSSSPPLLANGSFSASSGLRADPVRWGSFNQIASSLWWAVGMPNEKVEDAHFSVLYNTHDVTEAYAQTALDALNTAWTYFSGKGYTMPSNRIIVKIAPWLAPKQRPGATVGLLFNYHMALSAVLGPEELQDTAAHEFFHVLQRKNTSTAGYLQAPCWFLEGTATWAQWAVYPGHTGYQSEISGSLDFMNTGFDSWSGLNTNQQYATMALAAYLEEKKGAGSILQVLTNLGTLSNIKEALEAVTGNWGTFYGQFAKDYWMQTFAPVNTWNMEPAMKTLAVTQPSNSLYNQGTAALSSGLIKAYQDPASPGNPASFSQGVDSVARMPNSCAQGEVWIFDKAKTVLGSFIGQIDPLGLGFALPLRRIGQYTSSSPAYFLYTNNGASICNQQLVWEAPTITSLSPSSVPKNSARQISISGAGFGPSPNYSNSKTVVAGGANYTPLSWLESGVSFNLPGQSSSGTINVRVQTPTGALSNPMTLTITN